jgi:hypothetical protein
VASPLPQLGGRKSGNSKRKVVGRRRVERTLRSVSVNSGGDLPPLMRAARQSTGRLLFRAQGHWLGSALCSQVMIGDHDPVFVGVEEVPG